MAVPLGSFQKDVASGKAHVLQVTVTSSPGDVSTVEGSHDVFRGEAEETRHFE